MSRYPALIAAAAALFAVSPALAQQDPAADYPNRPVKIIVSVPAGGGVDTVTRIFAAGLQQHLGQPFVIENRGGAGGNLGAEAVYTADPDGYTLLASQPAPITSNVALYKKLNFDPAQLESVAVMAKFRTCCWCGRIFRRRRRRNSSLTRKPIRARSPSPRRGRAPPRT